MHFVMLIETAKDADPSINWDALTAIGTLILAALTATMAWYTARMTALTRAAVLDGQRARRESNDHFEKTRTQDKEHFEQTRDQDKEHHQDSFRPLLVLNQSAEKDPLARRNILRGRGQSDTPLFIQTSIQNIGVGPALHVRLRVRRPYLCGQEPFCDIDPVEAGKSLDSTRGPLLINAKGTSYLTDQEVLELPSQQWSLILEYEDVFGNKFHTIHAKDLQQPWTRADRGPAPHPTRPSPAVMAVVNQGDATSGSGGIGG